SLSRHSRCYALIVEEAGSGVPGPGATTQGGERGIRTLYPQARGEEGRPWNSALGARRVQSLGKADCHLPADAPQLLELPQDEASGPTPSPLPAAPPQIASSASTVRVLERQPVSLPCELCATEHVPGGLAHCWAHRGCSTRSRSLGSYKKGAFTPEDTPRRCWTSRGGSNCLPPGSRHSVRADGSLHLDQALLEDAGRYSCVVSNTAGSQHRDVQLVVQVLTHGDCTFLGLFVYLPSDFPIHRVGGSLFPFTTQPESLPLNSFPAHSPLCGGSHQNPEGHSPEGTECYRQSPWLLAFPPRSDFSMPKYWSGLPCPPPGHLPDPGSNLCLSPALAGGFFATSAIWEGPCPECSKPEHWDAEAYCRERVCSQGSEVRRQEKRSQVGLPKGQRLRVFIKEVVIQPTATHHITNEGVPASLPCVASGVPTPTITWTKTNALASGDPHYNVSNDGTLVIPRPSVQDAGAYVCTATNAVGFSSQEMWLSVNTKPRILVNGSHEADKPLRVTAKAGDEVILDCEAQGSPPPLIYEIPGVHLHEKAKCARRGGAGVKGEDSGIKSDLPADADCLCISHVASGGPWLLLASPSSMKISPHWLAATSHPFPTPAQPLATTHLLSAFGLICSGCGPFLCPLLIEGRGRPELHGHIYGQAHRQTREASMRARGHTHIRLPGQVVNSKLKSTGFIEHLCAQDCIGQRRPGSGLCVTSGGSTQGQANRVGGKGGNSERMERPGMLQGSGTLTPPPGSEEGRGLHLGSDGEMTGSPLPWGDLPALQVWIWGYLLWASTCAKGRGHGRNLGTPGPCPHRVVAPKPQGSLGTWRKRESVQGAWSLGGSERLPWNPQTSRSSLIHPRPHTFVLSLPGSRPLLWVTFGVQGRFPVSRGNAPKRWTSEGLGTTLIPASTPQIWLGPENVLPSMGSPRRTWPRCLLDVQGKLEEGITTPLYRWGDRGPTGQNEETEVPRDEETCFFQLKIGVQSQTQPADSGGVGWGLTSVPHFLRHHLLLLGSLHLAQAQVSDSGLYECTASNPAGSATQYYILRVQDLGSIPGLGRSPGGGRGNPFQYSCLEKSHGQRSLAGCSPWVPPQVQPGPRVLKVLVGEAVDLNCVAEGNPEPRGPEGSIHFTAIQTSHAGTYRCEASSSAGVDAWELDLRVLGECGTPWVCPKCLLCTWTVFSWRAGVWPGPALCDPMDCSMPGLPVHHQLLEGLCVFVGVYVCVHTRVPTLGSRTRQWPTPPCNSKDKRASETGRVCLECPELPGEWAGCSAPLQSWGSCDPSPAVTTGRLASWARALLERLGYASNTDLRTYSGALPGTPKPQVTWRKGPSSEPLRSLFLASVSPSDGGDYECQATNEAGSASRRAKLVVHVPPSLREDGRRANVSGMAGQSLTLECDANGFPAPEITWLKDGRQVGVPQGLMGSGIQEGDSGLYSCRAENQAGIAQRDFDLLVLIPPAVLGAEAAQEVVGLAGAGVELECRTSGVPTPQVEWTKDGPPLPAPWPYFSQPSFSRPVFLGEPHVQLQEDGQVLRITNSHLGDEGWYQCVAFSPAGQQTKDFQLRIYSPPTIWGSNETSEVAVMEGHPVWFLCEARGVPMPDITWFKDGDPLVPSAEVLYTRGGRQLQLERAQGSDAGTYSCKASNAVGVVEKTTRLEVYAPPRITLPPSLPGPVLLHSPVRLTCNATGTPSPLLMWLKDGNPVSTAGTTGLQVFPGGRVLTLASARASDSGSYSCVAVNAVGEDRRDVFLHVHSHPQPKVTWFKDGRPLAGGDTHHVSPDGALLWVLQANLSSAGHYSCVAANAIGEKSKHFQLSVLVVPTILGVMEDSVDEEVTVTINNPISLICEALAFPSPTITWMKDGAPFEASSNIQLLPGTHGLQILNAQKEDAGQYTCVVTNELGEAVKNYHVEVLIPPSISKDDPLGEVSVKEVKTKVNSTLTLECECWAVPPPTISWYKDGQPVTPNLRVRILGEGRLLQIQPTQVSDSGRYLCVATNVAGEDDQDFNVLIQVPPMFHKVSDATAVFETPFREEEARGGVTEYREVVENNPAYLYCDTNAVPAPELSWFREDHPLSIEDGVSILQGGRVLQIPLVRAEDAGRYSCRASNEAGEDWLHYELLVLTPPVILGETEELVEEVTVNANSTVSLYCPALGNPAPTISWLQNGLPFSPSPRLQVLEDGRILQVSTAEVADAASYMCVADNPAGSAEKLFTLRVQVPPRIAGPNPEQITATINSSVSLPCEVRAHPSPEVTWYKGSRTLSLGEEGFLLPGTHTLQLARAQLSDSGMYTCEALNAAGRDQKLVQLSVLVPPTFRQAPIRPQDVVLVSAGDKAVLSCETDALPAPTVAWQKDGQPLVLAERIQALLGGQRLEIQDAQVSDKGLYSCRVSNAAGEAMRAFSLTVQVPPTFENPETETVSQVAGSPLVLSCDVTGVPAPTVTWLKDRMPVESSVAHGVVSRGGRLQLSHLQPDQAGTYTCVAENTQAEARKDFVVAVLAPTTVAPRIWSSGTTQEHSVLEGQDVWLDCEAYGQPPPDVVWLKDGRPLDLSLDPHPWFYLDDSSLVLKDLRASDSGAYTCVAHNAAGEDARLHTVNVLVPPTIEQGPEGSGTLVHRLGDLVSMACPVRGSPPIHVSWLKDGLPLPLSHRTYLHSSGRTLRISQVQPADSGTFTCVASSPAGVANRHFVLQVHVPPVLVPAEFQNDVAVVRGSLVFLPCEARGSPLPFVSWMRDGEPLLPQSVEHGPGLLLESVEAGDAGTYSCVAVSEAGEARRHFQLTVMDPPYIEDSGEPEELLLTPGTPLELLCDARGTPTPNITWHKDGQALSSPEDGKGARRVLQVGDAGLYTCLAHSPAGEAEKSFRVRVQAPPNVIGPHGPRFVVGLAPGQLVLECSVEADPAPEIEWHREGILLQADAHTQFPEEGRFLQLQALSTADSGDYSCTARNAAGSTSLAFHVEVHMVPSIQPGPPVVNASVNQTTLLPCQADGAPRPLVSWLKDGVPLDPESPRFQVLPEGSLRIQPVLAQDAGHYLCLASNPAGSDRQGRDLRVFEPPAIAPGPSNLTLIAHTPASLPCEASGSPKPLVAWWKDGQKLDFRLHQGTYRLLPSNALLLEAPGPQDSAQFECVVSNEVGEARKLYWVTVHVAPTIADDQTDFTVTVTAPVVLTCHSTGVPAPVVSWSKAGTRLGVRGNGYRVLPSGALEIGQALPIHTGRYTCTARNAAGMAHKHVVLTVRASPVVKPLPSVVWAVAEEEVLLPCEASGLPRPSIAWQKEGLSVPAGAGTQVLPSGQLRIIHVSPEDAGNYFCLAQNSAGSAVGKTRLVVQVPPAIKTGLPDLSITEGAHALLPCTASGSPKPNITWEKDGQPVSGAEGKFTIQPSGELLVKNSESQDAGTYTCTAENAVGRAHHRVHLTILALPVFTTLPGDRSLHLGDRLWLHCAARGSPTPRIGWTVNNRLVTEGVSEQDGGSTLQRVAVTREDSGTYICWAENRVGRVQAVSFVHVKEAPVLQGESFSYLVEPVGGSIRLDCAVHGDPAPDIYWIKDGLPLRGSQLRHLLQNGSLIIRRTEVDDAGQYQCLAENELGAVEKVVVLALQSAPVFQVKPQDVTVRSGDSVALRCQASGEPVPTVEWLRAGQPVRASWRLQTLPDGSLWLERVEAGDAGPYECVAHNLLGSATARAFLVVRGEPRGSRGSVIGVINGQKFGAAILNTSVQQEARSGVTTIRSSISHIPASVGPLMRVLVVTIAPVYWALAGESGDALNGHSLTGGSFQQESHVEFATGELLTMTQVARGLDRNGLLLLDMVVNGNVPESLADADLQVQDFQERYVQTGPGRLFVGSTQSFLQDSLRSFLRCNHSIQYSAAQGPQPQLVQHLRASSISSAFDPKAEALRFQLDTALQAEENEVGCPEGFELDTQGEFCVDRDECSDRPRPCSHSCHNAPGRFSCSCPAGFALARDRRTCRDVDECAWEADLCQEDQHCVNLLGSYHCLPDCRPGFRVAADGASCEDVDECLEQTDECHYNQICENIPGGHRCGCPRGYRVQGPGLPCLDINECLQLPEPCAYQCHNLQGGFRCLCPPGHALLRDGRTCTPLERSGPNMTTVSHRDLLAAWLLARAPKPGGPYHAWVSLQPGPRALSVGRAWCPPGFVRQNGVCADLDECRVRNLCQHACQNTEGSYQCLCPAGYRLLPSGKNCQDINECEEDGIECGPGQMCFNTRGSYQCVDTPCPATYRQGSSPGTCFRRCSQDCSSGGPSTLQYKLLPLPLGVRALHDVARLAAFSEAGVPANRTELRVLEPDPRSPFALRPLRAGYGAVYTRRALTRAGLYRLTVHAAAPRHQSVFVLLIAVSPYPY
ncbi:hypothetical protein FD754_010757, partial [Muntiacus muntjak]